MSFRPGDVEGAISSKNKRKSSGNHVSNNFVAEGSYATARLESQHRCATTPVPTTRQRELPSPPEVIVPWCSSVRCSCSFCFLSGGLAEG